VSRRESSIGAIRVRHVINGLGLGGAQMVVARLVANSRREGLEPRVLSLMAPGVLAGQVEAAGVPLDCLDMPQGMPSFSGMAELFRQARGLRADVIQGWMYHGNLAALLLRWLAPGRTPLVWNIRHSVNELHEEKPVRRALIRLGAALSGVPAAIVYNSRISARQHERLGYAAARTVVIPNGFDCDMFRPMPGRRQWLRDLLGIDGSRIVLGQVARAHPMKDTSNLLRAVQLLTTQGIDLHLVLVGRGLDRDNRSLADAIGAAGLGDRVSLLGAREDVPLLLAGLDLFVLPSAWGEAFPNALGEAMACGLPCVATDVGDSAWILDDRGHVVPTRDPVALATAIRKIADLDAEGRERLGRAARERVIEHFTIDRVTRRYAELYAQILEPGAGGYKRLRQREA
jgi:glycosyltransferase involved in cell wall biosynthesis